MKISELQKTLEELKNEHGDLEVYFFPFGTPQPSPIESRYLRHDNFNGEEVILIDA